MSEEMHDPVNKPKHYTSHPSGIECIQITEHMGFNLGNAIKYVWRADLKHDAIEDLRKAVWYIEREIAKRTQPSEPIEPSEKWGPWAVMLLDNDALSTLPEICYRDGMCGVMRLSSGGARQWFAYEIASGARVVHYWPTYAAAQQCPLVGTVQDTAMVCQFN